MFNIILLTLLLGVCHTAYAQNSSTIIGARSNGMANASSSLYDVWSIFGNPAGLASINQSRIACTYDAAPAFAPFNRMALAAVVPLPHGVAAAGVYKFGDALYNEQLLSAGYANKVGLASLGLKVNYIQYTAESFGRKGVVTFSLGGIAELTPWLLVGAHIANINQPEVATGEKLPTRLHAGIGIRPIEKCFIAIDVEKDLDFDPTIKAGVEYELYKKIILRTGFNLSPHAGFAGIGFRPSRFELDYAYSYMLNLGTRHQASVSYKINKK
ncbi:MAG TPA: hypothetical protein VD884_01860 [Ohtaekwangia sp.]|nr:hypothetical protein [Ohtaekwangia sp.]